MLGRRYREEDEEGSAAKRPCIGDYARGSILKIRVHNFMTYGDAEIVPGSKLNLVLGPNGTGKSSLVNAICLGLAGSTSLLGRADNVRDFVRRGENEGWVEITLSSGNRLRPVVIHRKLKASENSSEWRINGVMVPLRDVKEKVDELKVQLDNLCQFLPQDKVVEFARLRPGQLLEETEKAIGDSSLHKLHQELIKERNECKIIESAANASAAELATLERQNDHLRRDVERFEQRETIIKEVEDCKGKLLWLKHQNAKKEFRDCQQALTHTRQRLAGLEAEDNAKKAPLREKKEKHTAAAAEAALLQTALKKLDMASRKTIEKDIPEKIEKIEEKWEALNSLEEEATKKEEEVSSNTARLAAMRQELEELSAPEAQTQRPELRQELQDLQRQKTDAVNVARGLEDEMEAQKHERDNEVQNLHRLEAQQNRLESVMGQKLNLLEQRHRGITRLAEYLTQDRNKAQFRGPVYGPLLCDVTVNEPEHANYLEQHLPTTIWARFVTVHREDQDQLSKVAREIFNFRPTITNFTGNVSDNIAHPFGDAVRFAKYGITHMLDEVFKAPPAVKCAMNEEARLNTVYIGSRRTNAEQFLGENPSIMNLMTPEAKYNVRVSKYNAAARSSSVAPIVQARLLSKNNGQSAEHELEVVLQEVANLRQRVRDFDAEMRSTHERVQEQDRAVKQLEAKITNINNQLGAARRKKTDLTTKIKVTEKRLTQLANNPDPHSKEAPLRHEIAMLNVKLYQLVAKLTKDYALLADHMKKHGAVEASVRELNVQEVEVQGSRRVKVSKEFDMQMRALERENQALTNSLRAWRERVTQGERLQQEFTAAVSTTKAKAEEATGPMDDDLKARQAALPDTQDALRTMMESKTAELDGVQLANPRAMQEYNARRVNIERMRAHHADQQENVDVRRASIEEKKGRWLPELKKIVEQINRSFGRSFEKIGCAGEVKLHEDDDFDKFAIHIKVKFREEEQLQLLTAHRQSGGERSVSTILYLIAIQGVTVCPFRVVDEINQGMDPVNERKVFMQLIDAACKEGTPQCFLLTPKLLPNLPFSPDVTVLQIMNGPLLKDIARSYNPEKLLGQRPLLMMAEA